MSSPPHLRQPGNLRGPLDEHFRPGVHDEEGRFTPKERAIADWLVAQDPTICIHPRHRDPEEEKKNPDAMVRTDRDDWGSITEFKALKEGNSAAVKGNIRRSIRQLLPHGNGHVVIDGRPVGLTEADARRGYARLAGERKMHRNPMPQKVTIILGDGRGMTWGTNV